MGGIETLFLMEQIPSGKYDIPTEDIILKNIIVYQDPFNEFQKAIEDKKKRELEMEQRKKESLEKSRLAALSKPKPTSSSDIGKYMNQSNLKRSILNDSIEQEPNPKKKSVSGRDFNFSNW